MPAWASHLIIFKQQKSTHAGALCCLELVKGITLPSGQLKPLAGLTQACFDHRLLERSQDVLDYADALPGSIPSLFNFKEKHGYPRGVSVLFFGASEGNRTPNLLITNELLYH